MKKTKNMITYTAGSGKGNHRVEAAAITCGRDVAVIVGGGTDYHIGAAVLSVPRPCLDNPNRLSSSSSVICVTGHKDDELARSAAGSLAPEIGCVVTVTAGLHIDNASPEDIRILVQNFSIVLDKIKFKLIKHYRS